MTPSRKLRCGQARRDPGGGGVNVARVVDRLGHDATALFPAGGSVGHQLRELIEKENIRSLAIAIDAETREDFTVVEHASGHEYRFVSQGPHLHEWEWRACLDAVAHPARPRRLYRRVRLPAPRRAGRFLCACREAGARARLADRGRHLWPRAGSCVGSRHRSVQALVARDARTYRPRTFRSRLHRQGLRRLCIVRQNAHCRAHARESGRHPRHVRGRLARLAATDQSRQHRSAPGTASWALWFVRWRVEPIRWKRSAKPSPPGRRRC